MAPGASSLSTSQFITGMDKGGSCDGISPTKAICVAACQGDNSNSWVAILPMIMAINMLGHCLRQRLMRIIVVKVMRAMTKLGQWVLAIFLLTVIQLRMKLPLASRSRPKAFLIWLVAITTAAPDVKPTTTE